ncbi:TRAP transporter permease [Halobacillus sp. A5]|uniref:TRAP transporter permease n=1 Tax=Halobacillus sp. A5 TaxID=2880263 RepID=UPI0020A6CA81|nr:TRAP transporter permease [Halobacillus sp. A5]MCP3028346.1 TRAP transporter permease [Halobacillus sp. A5]
MTSSIKEYGIVKKIIFPLTLILSLFQLYTGGFGVLTPMLQRGVHLTLVLMIIFLIYPISKSFKFRWLDYLAVILALASGIYLYSTYYDLFERVGNPNLADQIFAGVTIILLLEATRRLTGWILPFIGVLFLAYGFYGYLLGGMFSIREISYERMVSLVYMSTNGIWGTTLGVAATFIALFILFGAFLNSTGAGKLFVDMAFAIGGKFRGGPAKVSVLASALTGTISGSQVANVSITGQFTIPLMKKVGYKPKVAGGVESVASTGGAIMPPIMGAGAFVMAEMTGIPYSEIIIAALIPALLYFLSVYFSVDFEAAKKNMKGLKKEELPDLKRVAKQGVHLYIGLAVLIYMLMIVHSSPMRAACWAIVALVISTFIFKRKTIKWSFLLDALHTGAKGMLMVTVACGTAGIVVGIVNLTGIGITLTSLMIGIADSSFFLTLLIATVASIILGMGLPPTAAYILLGVLTAPALVEVGLPVIVAHMFVYYYTCLAPITPPVALASYTAAGIAGSNPMATSFTSLRIGLVGFIIPFMFVYGPALLFQGDGLDIILAFTTSLMGVILLSSATVGWMRRSLTLIERVIPLAASLLLIFPESITDTIGIALAICFVGYVYLVKTNVYASNSKEEAQ